MEREKGALDGSVDSSSVLAGGHHSLVLERQEGRLSSDVLSLV